MIALLVESAGRSLILFAVMIALSFLLRIHNKSGELFAWRIVLLSAFLIPVFLQLRIISIPAALDFSPTLLPVATEASSRSIVGLTEVLSILYAIVATTFGLRVVLGILASWRLRRAAHKPNGDSLDSSQALVSDTVAVPVTVGSTVLLPADYSQWSAYKLQAVLAHETTHARHGDFYWHVASLLFRAIFWINPLAWWLPKRMAELAEARCDQMAVNVVGEAADYAQLLVDFSKKPNSAPLAVAMARSADLQRRVEQLLDEQVDYSVPSGRLHKGGASAVVLATLLVCASCAHQSDPQRQAVITPPTKPSQAIAEKEVIALPRLHPEGGSTKPKYDSSEHDAGHEGTVYLQVLIDASGRVADVIIHKSSGYDTLDKSAMTEVRDHWRFLPGTSNGIPVDLWVTIPIVFKIAAGFPNPVAQGLVQAVRGDVDALDS